ncbi:MAG: hypothetical protein CSA10_00940 [Cardiobacteriales bacterium]|nr:MAG: hypothetical protein CSA10_00940 [Cardiobacteriales bacterium]
MNTKVKVNMRSGGKGASAQPMPMSMELSANMVSKVQGDIILPPRQNTERYGHYEQNPVYRVKDNPVSTLSIDVDTGSYSNVRRFLSQDKLPPVDAVRSEEMINYFTYHYPAPTEHPFSVVSETVDSPWQNNAKLIKLGLATKPVALNDLPPANLVFLVDVSGSMHEENKLPMVQTTLCLLTQQLRDEDTVSIVTYASGNDIILKPTKGKSKDKILKAIDGLKAGGATAGESAIRQAYEQAEEEFKENGINRIILTTDGDFNVGITDFETLKGLVAEKRHSGVSLTTLGYGEENYNEELMEQLADVGDGNYSYIDSDLEALKVMQQELSATLATVAKDVKIQVEFNPNTVKEYRLIGYENRLLADEDFNNDQVDAGEIGAGHQVTVLYEMIPVGVQGWLDESHYQQNLPITTIGNENEYAYVKIRYKQPQGSDSILLDKPITTTSKPLYQASDDTRFAVAVAGYAELLRNGKYSGKWTWDDVITTAEASHPDMAEEDKLGLRTQFVELAKIAGKLSSQ